MADRTPGLLASPVTRALVKVVVYYAIVIALWFFIKAELPASQLPVMGLESMLGAPGQAAKSPAAENVALDQTRLTLTVLSAMAAAILLSLPVAWIYQLTRAKRGYQQSVVQLLIILPLVVAGIVVMVKYSLALAFSLAGIVAAVRFRNTLEDSKDAVYVFLATGIGLASAVDIPVAMTISLLFNVTIVILWYTDFGISPVELEGSIAARRLKRAKQLARTGTFVAQIDNEVMRNMTREQLEGLAMRALKRAHDDSAKTDASARAATRLRVRSRDLGRMQRTFDLLLDDFSKEWQAGEITTDGDGIQTIDYVVVPKKSRQPEELLVLAQTAGGSALVDAQLR
ncbi:MAG TPA: DUF4956 domain-containing protein [Gemmatimonadaceae bacterium]